MKNEITAADLMFLIGQKEVELSMLRQKLAEAEAKLAELTKKDNPE